MMSKAQTREFLWLIAMASSVNLWACGEAKKTYPQEIVGRWQRQVNPNVWGDTLEFQPDGKVQGTSSHPIPTSAYWYVAEHKIGSPTLCFGDETGFDCRGYVLTADSLRQIGGPTPPVTFRRVR